MSLEKQLVRAAEEGRLWDFVANHYHEMSAWQLKEVLFAVLGVVYDHCGGGTATADSDYKAFQKEVVEELADREFGTED